MTRSRGKATSALSRILNKKVMPSSLFEGIGTAWQALTTVIGPNYVEMAYESYFLVSGLFTSISEKVTSSCCTTGRTGIGTSMFPAICVRVALKYG